MDMKWIWGAGLLILAAVGATFWVEAKKDAVDHAPPPNVSPSPSPAAEGLNAVPPVPADSGAGAPPRTESALPPPSAYSNPGTGSTTSSQPAGDGAYSPPPYQPVSPDYDQVPPPPPQNFGADTGDFDPENQPPQLPGGAGYDSPSTGGETDYAPVPPPPPPPGVMPPADE